MSGQSAGLFMAPGEYLDLRDPAWVEHERAGGVVFVAARGRGNPAEVIVWETAPEVYEALKSRRGCQ